MILPTPSGAGSAIDAPEGRRSSRSQPVVVHLKHVGYWRERGYRVLVQRRAARVARRRPVRLATSPISSAPPGLPHGTFLAKWGTTGSGNGQFNLPRGVAADASGNVFIADRDNHRIQKFACAP